MKARIHRGARDLWLPALVVLFGWSLAGLGWHALIQARQNDLVSSVQSIALDSAFVLEEHLASQRTALEGFAELWALSEHQSLAEWRADAQSRIETRNGLTAIEWIEYDQPGDEKRRVVGEVDAPDAPAADDATGLHPVAGLLGPDREAGGSFSYRIVVPARDVEGHLRTLVAHVDVSDFLAPVLHARARGHAFEVTWRGQRIFADGQATPDPDVDWWRAEIDVPLPGDPRSPARSPSVWRITYRPTSQLVAQRLPWTPHYLLGAAMILSLVIGIMIHQWRVVSRQARFLEVANQALEEKGQGLQELNAELERRVADRTERLEDVVAELEAFNYSVSHDLRSPLGAVLNLAAILEEEYAGRPLDDKGLELLTRIQNAATRATNLLEDLLQLSRTGQGELDFETIDTEALAREMFAQARASEAEPDVELVVEPLPTVRADKTLLGVIFANLFSNAMKYSRGCEKRRITVKGEIRGDECLFEVADNGHGFDMRFAGKLFGLFERLHGDDEIEGTGVGLAMVSRIAKRHGGRTWASGEVGRGARFGFSIRRSEGDEV